MVYYVITNRTNGAIGIANRQISPGKSITVPASVFDHQPYRNGLNILLRNELITCVEKHVEERIPGHPAPPTEETPVKIVESVAPSDPTEKAPVEETPAQDETEAPVVEEPSEETSAIEEDLLVEEDEKAEGEVGYSLTGSSWTSSDSGEPVIDSSDDDEDFDEEDDNEYDFDDEE